MLRRSSEYTDCLINQVAELQDLGNNVVGSIEVEDGKPVVHLVGEWEYIATLINNDIRSGSPLISRDHRFERMTGVEKEHIATVVHTTQNGIGLPTVAGGL